MAASNRIINDIAQAVVKTVNDEHCTEKLLEDIEVLAEMFKGSPELIDSLSDESVSLETRYVALKQAGHELHSFTVNALALLIQHGKLNHFRDFQELVSTAAREISQHYECTVHTAVPMEPEDKKKLKASLEKRWNGTVSINYKIDPEVIGGLSVSCGDWRFVSTIQSKLQQLTKHLAS